MDTTHHQSKIFGLLYMKRYAQYQQKEYPKLFGFYQEHIDRYDSDAAVLRAEMEHEKLRLIPIRENLIFMEQHSTDFKVANQDL